MTLLLRQKFTPAASKQMALDLVERAAVVFLFVFFAVRMLPRLAQLIQLQVTYPELIVAAAGISALLLAVSEDAPVGPPGGQNWKQFTIDRHILMAIFCIVGPPGLPPSAR